MSCSGGNPWRISIRTGHNKYSSSCSISMLLTLLASSSMKPFGKAEDPVGARLALVPIVFSLPYRIFKKKCPSIFMILQLEIRWKKGK